MSSLNEIYELTLTKLELAKLKAIDRVTGSFAKIIGLGIVVLVAVFLLLSILVLSAAIVGLYYESIVAGLTTFTLLLALLMIVIVGWQRKIIVQPLKNFLVLTLYENSEND